MTVLMPVTLLAILRVLVLSFGEHAGTFWPSLAGLRPLVVTVLVTVLVEVPVVTRIRGWTPTTLPENWRQQRDRWLSFHLVRLAGGLAAPALLVAGAVVGSS